MDFAYIIHRIKMALAVFIEARRSALIRWMVRKRIIKIQDFIIEPDPNWQFEVPGLSGNSHQRRITRRALELAFRINDHSFRSSYSVYPAE